MKRALLRLLFLGAALAEANTVAAQPASSPSDARADALAARLSPVERADLLHGHHPPSMKPRPADVPLTAGWLPGAPTKGLAALVESDASLGVAAAGRPPGDETPLPSGMALAATWSPQIAYAGGAMIGEEAHRSGFNILLAGGVNLVRDPRNGRNFEYAGEDPLLAGTLAGESIRGIQSRHVASTVKHLVLNAQETGRFVLDARIDPAALRESDLLAFEIAVERGRPASVMCAYNRINGVYACENGETLGALRDWRYPGWVMSDWGAVHSTAPAALAGLDQESGAELDQLFFHKVWFAAPLQRAVADGSVPRARYDDMVQCILRSLIEAGVVDDPATRRPFDSAADAAVAKHEAEQAITLLKNQGGLLPAAASARSIVVIGGHADVGVLSGGGSSQVIPKGSLVLPAPRGAPSWGAGIVYHPSSPLRAIAARASGAKVTYDDGSDPARAAALARGADLVVVFATQWTSEAFDTPFALDGAQDRLIEAVAAANPRMAVVLETGGPVTMPWLSKVPAVVEAWYPGARGGEAIAEVLFGDVDPAGRLPVTFPADAAQLPRPVLPGAALLAAHLDTPDTPPPFTVNYDVEGADVGYRWFERTGAKPLFPFGFGLSYARFRYDALQVTGGEALGVRLRVTNTGARAGWATPQVYAAGEGQQPRLVGWSRIELQPGESRTVQVAADPRLLARFDVGAHAWRLAAGRYRVLAGADAADRPLTGEAMLTARTMAP